MYFFKGLTWARTSDQFHVLMNRDGSVQVFYGVGRLVGIRRVPGVNIEYRRDDNE